MLLFMALLAGFGTIQDPHATHAMIDRQAVVAEAGAAVMPFDLNRTLHRFETRVSGGVQTVVSRDGDADQIALIRDHLRAEAVRFASGEFGSPAAIHGEDMPGLRALSANASQIQVAYLDRPDGGEIRFSTPDAALTTALHVWFAAQLADHGAHATAGGHNHH